MGGGLFGAWQSSSQLNWVELSWVAAYCETIQRIHIHKFCHIAKCAQACHIQLKESTKGAHQHQQHLPSPSPSFLLTLCLTNSVVCSMSSVHSPLLPVVVCRLSFVGCRLSALPQLNDLSTSTVRMINFYYAALPLLLLPLLLFEQLYASTATIFCASEHMYA